jgi:predicted transcriptional regulator
MIGKNRNKIKIRRDILEIMMTAAGPITKWRIKNLAYCEIKAVEYLIKIGLIAENTEHSDSRYTKYSISKLGIESLEIMGSFLRRKQASQSQL